MKFNNLSEFKKSLSQLLKDTSDGTTKKIIYNRGLEYPKYQITIEEIEEDYFVDSKGVKWVKASRADSQEDDES